MKNRENKRETDKSKENVRYNKRQRDSDKKNKDRRSK